MSNFEEKYNNGNLDQIDLEVEFSIACQKNNLDEIKYLLTHTKLKDTIKINERNYLAEACLTNNVDLVKYFFTCETIENYNDLGANTEWELLLSCNGNHLNVVKFLLSAPEVEKKPDIHYKGDLIFNNALNNSNIELLKYFIIDLQIEKTEGIQKRLNTNKTNIEINKQVEKMFQMRELQTELKENLSITNKKNIKI